MTTALREFFSSVPRYFSGELKFDEPLSRYTYYRIGGPAEVLAIPKTREDLEWIVSGIQATRSRHFLLGAGSNLLVSDRGYDGVAIRTGKLNNELRTEGDRVHAGASVMISSLLRRASQEGWGGLEFLTGIPGTLGGAVRMNAGTHLGETRVRLTAVDALLAGAEGRLQARRYSGDELRFEYRKNLFLPAGAIVWSTEWRIDREKPETVKSRIDETLQRRKATQPVDFPSCGSVFKNPKSSGLSAWQVVDRLGLRGHRIGNAQISEKHGNFIVNLGGAKAADVRALIDLVKTRARSELAIELQEEVIFVE